MGIHLLWHRQSLIFLQSCVCELEMKTVWKSSQNEGQVVRSCSVSTVSFPPDSQCITEAFSPTLLPWERVDLEGEAHPPQVEGQWQFLSKRMNFWPDRGYSVSQEHLRPGI